MLDKDFVSGTSLGAVKEQTTHETVLCQAVVKGIDYFKKMIRGEIARDAENPNQFDTENSKVEWGPPMRIFHSHLAQAPRAAIAAWSPSTPQWDDLAISDRPVSAIALIMAPCYVLFEVN